MRLREVTLANRYNSASALEFQLAPLTVLFGRNNSGKTNVLEALYCLLAPDSAESFRDSSGTPPPGMRGPEFGLAPHGCVLAELEAGLPFDDDILAVRNALPTDYYDGASALPANQAAFVSHHNMYPDFRPTEQLAFADPRGHFRKYYQSMEDQANAGGAILLDVESFKSIHRLTVDGPHVLPVFLDWDADGLGERVAAALLNYRPSDQRPDRHISADIEKRHNQFFSDRHNQLWEHFDPDDRDEDGEWRISAETEKLLNQFSERATSFLPDFIDGSIHAYLPSPPWGQQLPLTINYRDPGWEPCADPDIYDPERPLAALGRGTARWAAIAVQMALQVVHGHDVARSIRVGATKVFSGGVLFVDEPEAHLHSSAVASVVRWCHLMVAQGFNVVVASHHDQFLRTAGDDVVHVHITRNPHGRRHERRTRAQTLISSATPLLQELAADAGMHPAVMLSLYRAVLFVEGPLDVAVLDEYAGPEFDAVGVRIVPVHGTHNLEGLIEGEFTQGLGIKVGVLTDHTVVETMNERSNRKRSTEEKKLIRLLERFEETGTTPPKLFGVPEDDLLFALPEEAIRDHYNISFPGWRELVKECRVAENASGSQSVHWKQYAETTYGLPITAPNGVRSVVHTLDVSGGELPSVRAAVDEIIAWARAGS
ncbi:AAA family ATPase [Mycolicibacterium elephantis]